MMGSDFKTYEKQHIHVCGTCRHRGKITGFCPKEASESKRMNMRVERGDPACKHYENN